MGTNGAESTFYHLQAILCKKMQRATQRQEKGSSNHYPVTGDSQLGKIGEDIRTQQASSDPSTEYSPKIQGFMVQILPKDNGDNFVFRSPWLIFIVNFPVLNIYELLHLVLIRCFAA